MLYEYTKTQLPLLSYIHDEVAVSAMEDKSIEWCNWEEDEQKLKVNFTNTLSTGDETILDSIVAACPNETNDAPGEMSIKNGDKYIGFKSPEVLTEDTIYVLPEDGATGQAMVTDGDKNLSFETIPKHTQNTDQKLDEGGEFEILAEEIEKKATIAVVTYYVDCDNGNDSNPGTSELPFQTIQHAIDSFPKILGNAGGAIYLEDSLNYNEHVIIAGFHGGVITIKGRSSDNSKVLITSSSKVFTIRKSSVNICLQHLSMRTTDILGSCILVSLAKAYIYSCKFADNDGVATYGIKADNHSSVIVRDASDYDTKKVGKGLYAELGSIIIHSNSLFGDTNFATGNGGIITDTIILKKVDYDDAVNKKHDGTVQISKNGINGTFTTLDEKTITIVDGQVTSIV